MERPIFCVTHPRACSTAFERVFMTRTKDLTCVHEPFGDAFYFGPERLSSRYENDETSRIESGYADSTFKTVLDRIEDDAEEGKRVFIKDIIHYLLPPCGKPAQIAPSLLSKRRGIGTENGVSKLQKLAKSSTTPFPYGTETEPGNPTVIPTEILKKFHFTFLIRDPHSSIPSYYRCTIPPLDKVTGFFEFYPSEAGYDEVRRVFDFLVATGEVGPKQAGARYSKSDGRTSNGTNGHAEQTDGHTNERNGLTNGVNGHDKIVNGHTNGINGHTDKTDKTDKTNGNTNGNNGYTNGTNGHITNGFTKNRTSGAEICLVDADDLLDNPEGIIKEYCRSVGLDYDPTMLNWNSDEAHSHAKDAFEKWRGFHEDAIHSKDLKPRAHKKKEKTEEEWDTEWKAKYGEKGAKIIRETVDANMEDYLYLKQFAMKV